MKYKRVFQTLAFSITLSLLLLEFPVGVVLAAPAITLSAASGTVGSTLTVSGTGFTTNTTGTVTFGSGSTFPRSYSATSDNTGAFSTSFSVPTVPSGTYTILATVGISASTSFTVTPAVILSTTSAHVGDSISVSGTGFSASLTASIAYDGTTITSVTIGTNGSFDATLTVPHSVYGTHMVMASDSILSASTTLWVTQFVNVSSISGEVGSSVTITGTGFSGSAAVTVNLDGTQVTLATSDAHGDFSVSFTVPAITGGTHTIAASDGTASASATFTLLSTMRLSASSGYAGALLTVSGSAFRNSTTITISLDDTQITQATTDVNGSFSVSLTVPASPGGAHTLTASDGALAASAAFTVLSSIKVNPTSGKVGSQTIVSGTGFGSSTSVGVSFDNALLATVNADANGSFSASVNIPPTPSGSHVVSANDGALAAKSTFTTLANIAVSPDRGPMGTQVTITGTGFAATGAITIQMGNTTVKNATADTKGSFSEKFLVPQLDAGNYNLTIADGTNSMSVPFIITASFSISPTTGNVGSNMAVSGTGFSGAVSIRYDDLVVATVTAAGANGAFSAIFIVPASIHGSHIISVNDATNRLQLTFTMDSTPPPIPALLQPQAVSRQNAQPTLIWTPATDPSGVTYTMQIAPDASFANLVLEKDALTATQYKLVRAERLRNVSKNTPYYWRVKAVDLAQNESNWSTPSSFYVTLLPPWAMWTLIGIGVLIAVLLLVWLGARRGRSSLKAEADTTSATIITDVRQEADQILPETEQKAAKLADRAKAEARTKSATIITNARQEAVRVLRKAKQTAQALTAKEKVRKEAEAESARIVADARQKADKVLREAQQAAAEADAKSAAIVTNARQEADKILRKAEQKAAKLADIAETEAAAKSATIITDAQQGATQILREAEQKAAKLADIAETEADAKSVVIIADAGRKAARILREAEQAAAETDAKSATIITDARQEADQILREAEQAAAEADAKSAAIITDARQEADQILRKAEQAAAETSAKSAAIITDSRQEADKILRKAEQKAAKLADKAKTEARTKSAAIVTNVRQEAAQVLRKAKKTARALTAKETVRKEAKAESARMVADARQKADQILREAKQAAADLANENKSAAATIEK